MKIYYLSHQYSNNLINLIKAETFLMHFLNNGFNVIAPWILSVRNILETPSNRYYGLLADIEIIKRCDGLLLCGDYLSSGMKSEKQACATAQKPIFDLIGSDPLEAVRIFKELTRLNKKEIQKIEGEYF